MEQNDIDQNKVFAVLSYFWILFLIPILAKKDSAFAMYHAKQGLVFFIYSTISGFVIWVPVIGWILGVFGLILFIMGIINSASGKTQPLPLIGKIGEGFKF
jgi:uncharacterized membrane protein